MLSFFCSTARNQASCLIQAVDARIKLFLVLLLTMLIFLIDGLEASVCVLISLIVIRLISKIPFRGITYFKNLTLLAAFIIPLQMIFAPGDSYIVKPLFPDFFPVFGGAGSLKHEGLIIGIVIICRLASLMIILPVFTDTTPPFRIAAGLCSLGLNYRIAFIMTTAFNLISRFRDEALAIMEVQKLRGMRSFGIKAVLGLAIPLMLGAMRKARNTSAAMDCRAFGIHKNRTWIDRPKMKASDFYIFAGGIVFFVIMILINQSLSII